METNDETMFMQLLSNFRSTFSAIDDNERKSAETYIKSVENNCSCPFDFIDILFTLITKNIQIHDNQVKISIIIRIKQTIAKAIQSHSFSLQQKSLIINKIIEVITEKNINTQIILTLTECFENLLKSIGTNCLFINELTKNMELYLSKIINNESNIIGFIHIMLSIISVDSFNEETIETTVTNLLPYAKPLLHLNYNKYLSSDFIHTYNQYEHKNPSFIIQLASSLSGVFKFLHHIILETHRKKMFSKSLFILNSFIQFIQIGLSIVFEKQNELAILWTNNTIVDQSVNSLKLRILKLIDSILALIDKGKIIFNEEITILFNNMITLVSSELKLIVSSKIEYILRMSLHYSNLTDTKNRRNINHLQPNYEYSRCIHRYFLILSKAINMSNLLNISINDLKILFKDIILPLLIITQHEIYMSSKNSESTDYEIYFNDIITSNRNDSIKSGAAMLLRTIFNSSHSMRNYILKYSLILFENSFSKLTNCQIESSIVNNIINNDDTICVLLQNDYEKILDLSLMIFILVSNGNENLDKLKQTDIKFKIIDSISKRLVLLLQYNTIHIKFKILVLVDKYGECLNIQDKESENYVIDYLFKHLLEEDNLLLNKASGIILKNKFSSFDISSDVLNSKLLLFTNKIEYSSDPEFFELFYEIKKTIGPSSIDFSILHSLFIKSCKEISNYEKLRNSKQNNDCKSKSKIKHLLIKCLNLITEMFTDRYGSFIKENQNKIIDKITPLFKYAPMIKVLNSNFILSQIIKYTQTIPTFNFDLMTFMMHHVKKNGYLYMDLLYLINNFIIYYDNASRNKIYPFINELATISYNDQITYKLSYLFMCTIIQTWFLNEQNIPEKEIYPYINKTLLTLINMSNNNKYNTFDQYYFTCNLTLLFVSFIQNIKLINELLLQQNINQEIIKQWCMKILEFDCYCSYHIKTIILNLALFIDNGIFGNDTFFYVEFGYKLLIKQHLNEKKQRMKGIIHIKNDYQYDSDDENEFENYEDDDVIACNQKEQMEKDIIQFQSTIFNPQIEGNDEFVIFIKSVENLKTKNEGVFNEWVNSLTEKDKEEFRMIANVKRRKIEIIEDGVKKEVKYARRIVHIKRNNNNYSDT